MSHAERRSVFGSRMIECVSRAFRALGTSSVMEDFIYWKLSLGLNEIVDKPKKFMEGLKGIYGDAGAAVYEYKLVKEVQREFNLVQTPGKEELTGNKETGEMLQAAVTAAWMAS